MKILIKAELLFSFGDFIYNTKTNSLKLNDKEVYLTEGRISFC
jgi:DNA-binding winged helix-turn-helix (wHTH) protein